MKSKDLQNVVLSKYEKGEGPTKIFRDLNGTLCLHTIKRWCKMIGQSGSIQLLKPPDYPRIVRTKGASEKVTHCLQRKKPISTRKLAGDLGISQASVQLMLREDLGLKTYKKVVEPMLTDEHKGKRNTFANWVRTNFRKEETMNIFFSDEKMFDIDGVYSSQNDRVWAVDRVDADTKGGIKPKRKFPQKVMVWLGVCSKGVTPLVIFDNDSVDHARYTQEVLPVALEYGNKVLGSQ
ncbi:unnamed protein product [Rotaria socialis]|uniref:Transposase n=1 Tax=Rotaria socialis TaxID=392032 RepID=A0A818DGE4_9BILA|nr:unnamed protein product [Rotaria socialis]CAF3447232.1 unnamed protein product [Rotaria socialis]CAF4657373.1 unnamed protein product [Rotaria socialis]CAF4927687.1 unnamed protein product [Rotaria socialis]